MGNYVDLTGQRFGRLTVIERAENKYRQTMWACRCDCGNTVTVQGKHLKDGFTTSCGCFRSEYVARKNIVHGHRREKLYEVYKSMKQRCRNPNNKKYMDYGGRGITVCDEWQNDYLAFRRWAIANQYQDGLSIDRIDNTKGYCPENCRWTDNKTQANNRRNVHIITHNGTEKTITQLAEETGLNRGTLYRRLVECKWDVDRALVTPVNK